MKKQYKDILRVSVGTAWTCLPGSGRGEQRGLCSCGTETSGFIKFGKFCDELKNFNSQEGLYSIYPHTVTVLVDCVVG